MTIDKLDQVSDMIQPLLTTDMNYFKLCGNSFRGVLLEVYRKDDTRAEEYYYKTLHIANSLNTKNINALAVAYAGLARINDRKNNSDKAKEYYKLAAKYSRTESIKVEAKEYVRNH